MDLHIYVYAGPCFQLSAGGSKGGGSVCVEGGGRGGSKSHKRDYKHGRFKSLLLCAVLCVTSIERYYLPLSWGAVDWTLNIIIAK